MKNNKYTKAVDSLKISDSALNRALSNVRNNQPSERVVPMRRKGRRMIIAASAACLAAAVALGGIYRSGRELEILADGGFCQSDSDTEGFSENVEWQNSFIVLANSQKITADSEVAIGEFITEGSYTSYASSGSGNRENPITFFRIGRELQIPIQCVGENIESVTYSIENYVGGNENISDDKEGFDMRFSVDDDYDGIIDTNANEYFMKKNGIAAEGRTGTYFTCAYDKQPVAAVYDTITEQFKGRTSRLVLDVRFNCKNDRYPELTGEEYFTPLTFDNIFPVLMTDSFAKYHDNLKIDITANFTDGTSRTKTVQLLFDSIETSDTVTDPYNVVKGILTEPATPDENRTPTFSVR